MRYRRQFRLKSTVAIVAAVCLLSATGATAAKKAKPTDRHYQHAIELLAQNDHRGAIIELKNALQADPKDLAARVLLGNTYLEMEDGASAAKELKRARKDGAGDSFVLAPIGRAYVLQGQYHKALKELSSAGQDTATAVEIAIILGDAHLALSQLRDAETSYLKASKMRPKDAKPLVGMARVKMAQDDLIGAANYAKWALEANNKDFRAWYIQGEVAERQNRPDDALVSYGKAIELSSKSPRARLARAAILIDRRQFDEAAPDIENVRRYYPRNPRAAFLLSLVMSHNGNVQEAQALLFDADRILKGYPKAVLRGHPPTALLAGVVAYTRNDLDASFSLLTYFLRQFPHHAGARKLLASIMLTWNEPETVLQLLAPLDPAKSTDVEVLTMFGDALARVKRYSEANKILDRAASSAKPGSSSLFKLVVVRLGANQNDEAIKLLESEIKRDPEAVKATILLGTAYMRSGNFKAALQAFNKVTERHPNHAVAHNLAGGAHLGLGEVEAARKRYRASIDASPKYLHALENLAKVEARLGNFDEAGDHFSTILEHDPRNGKAMISQAEIAHRQKDMEATFRWLEKARTSSRDAHDAALRLIDLYIGAARADDALMIARTIYGERPDKLEFLLTLGRAQLAAKKTAQAVATFKKLAVRAGEENLVDYLYRAARWQIKAFDQGGAQDTLLKILSINEKHIPAHLELFQLEQSAGLFRAALDRARKIAAIDVESPAGLMLQGDVHMQEQRYGAAIKAYDSALKKKEVLEIAQRAFLARRAAKLDSFEFAQMWANKYPEAPVAQRLLATAHADAGRLDDAIKIYEDLLSRSPKNISFLNDLALLYVRAGDEKALEFARRAYEIAPKQPATMDTYGWALVRGGDIEEGLRLLRNAKLRAPTVPEIRYHLAVALNAQGKTAEAQQELREALRPGRPFDSMNDARALFQKLSAVKR